MYTIYNTQLFSSAQVDEAEGTIKLKIHGETEPLFINKDDELYEEHLRNLNTSKEQIKEAFAPEKGPSENPLDNQ